MSNKEMHLFKDEILNKLRELETKFFNEISRKNSDINFNLNTFNEKVNSIIESNSKMIAAVTSQKLNIEKISQLDTSRKHMDEVLTTHDVKISCMTSEIDKMKFKYDKLIGENLIIPGFIGAGCSFRNLREFVVNSIVDIKKLKEEKEMLKRQEKELKSKVELMLKNMTNMVEYNSARIREYTNSKDHEIEDMLNDKLKQHDEKTLESNRKLIDTQNILEEKIKEISNEIGKINSSKEDINSVINMRFEEINKREEEMNEKLYLALFEVKEVQKMKKELAEEIKNIYSKMDSMDKNKKQEKINENNLKEKTIFSNLHINTNYNITNNDRQIYNIKSLGYTKKEDLPNLNTQTKVPQNNNNSFLNKNVVIKTDHDSIVSNNFSLNSINSKKFVLKEEDFLKTKQNLKIKNLNMLSKKNEIKEEIFQNNLNNINIERIEKKNDDGKILSKKSIKHFFDTLETNFVGPKLKLANLEYKKKISDKLLSMSDDEDLKKSNDHNRNSDKNNNRNIKTLNNPDNKDNNKNIRNTNYKNNKFIKDVKNNIINYMKDSSKTNNTNNTNIDTVNKNIQTPSRNIKSVNCNLINLNLLDVPNINDNNKSNDSNNNINNEIMFRTVNGRKIYSVDAKRRRKKSNLQSEKISNKFLSSKNIFK